MRVIIRVHILVYRGIIRLDTHVFRIFVYGVFLLPVSFSFALKIIQVHW